ncbi:putative mixed-linked glucanase, partial [Rhypophila sp. PSN 637]
MAPSFSTLATAAALVSGAIATGTRSYQLTEHYNATNFFDKFEFFVSDFDRLNEDPMAVDPTHGFVDYLSRNDAFDAGLITAPGQDIAIRVDSTNNYVRGRASVRLESHTRYNDGLIIAHFTHFPRPVCGAWPAFWMYGPNWPHGGELDIYEKWNLSPTNSITAHTAGPDDIGACNLDQSLSPATSECWISAPTQWPNEGCSVTETNGQWGNPEGGVYAVEWTERALKVWSWPVNSIPQDIVDGTPDPSSWQNPHFFLNENTCDVPRAFKDMRLVIDVTFCGDAAGNQGLWGASAGDMSKCSGITGETWCPNYVNNHASEYADVYWEVEDIKHYRLQQTPQPSSSSAV